MRLTYNDKIISRGDAKDYSNLQNKPQINEVELVGSLSTEDIKVTKYCSQDEYDTLNSEGLLNPTTMYVIDNGELIGEGDSFNYNELYNKPSINNGEETIVLEGTKTLDNLNLYSKTDIDTLLSLTFASSEGTSTKEAKYITINGDQWKLGGGAYVEIDKETITSSQMDAIVDAGKVPYFGYSSATDQIQLYNCTVYNTSSPRSYIFVNYMGRVISWFTFTADMWMGPFTLNNITTAEVIDNLTSTATEKPLAARQGKVLKELIDSEGRKYLPLAGGTMTGSITFNQNTALKRNDNASDLIIHGGTEASDGAYVDLAGANNTGLSDTDKGRFVIGTANSATRLIGLTGGGLKWVVGSTWRNIPSSTLTDTTSQQNLTNPSGITGTVYYQVINGVVHITFQSVTCTSANTYYYWNLPSGFRYNGTIYKQVLSSDMDTIGICGVNNETSKGLFMKSKAANVEMFGSIVYVPNI